VAFKDLELDLMGNQGVEIQTILKERTVQSTVPSVWVLGKFIGKHKLKIKFEITRRLN
jgi:hypothetical protein